MRVVGQSPARQDGLSKTAGLARYADDASVDADYIVVEMARHLLGEDWMADYVRRANAGGIERVLV